MFQLLLAALLFIPAIPVAAYAADTPAPKLVLQAERSSFYGMEQTTLIFEEQRVVFVTNSNFLQASPRRALLGELESGYTDKLQKSKAQVQEARLKPAISKEEKRAGYVSPHEVKILIGGERLSVDSKEYRDMLGILEGALALGEWKSRDALEVMPAAKGIEGVSRPFASGESVSTAPRAGKFTPTPCQDLGSRDMVCRYPQYGYARLRKGSAQ